VKSVPTESRSASDAVRAWHKEVEHWHGATQRFLTETLAELRELIETVEVQVQQETVSRVGRVGGKPPESATPAPIAAAIAVTLPETRVETPGGELPEPAGAEQKPSPLHSSGAGANGSTSDDRLAQLARRLEEKLERSSSRALDSR
jgi:hypothetical protein